MGELHELTNLRVILVTTAAAVLSAPRYADAHRRQAALLLDNAEQRTSSPRVRAEIESVRMQVAEAAEDGDRSGDG